jgi:hypothetical protein
MALKNSKNTKMNVENKAAGARINFKYPLLERKNRSPIPERKT